MNSTQENTTTHPARGYGELLRRSGFASLLGAQALAVFDDNTFRQLLALFIAAHVASIEKRSLLISAATGLFVLPYILLSAYAGQVADRFSKRHVIIAMKVVESVLLGCAAVAMYLGHITGMLVMLFLLGIHSAFLDPAKEGILPQLFPEHDLPLANGLMQLTIYSMIVLGPVAGGFLLDAFPARPYIPVALLVGMALTGLTLALRITLVPPIGAHEKFRWNPLGEFWHDFGEIRASKPLLLTVLAIAYFWLLGAVYLQNVVGYGHDLLHLGNAGISVLTAAVSVGIGLGAFAAGKLSGEQVELGLVPIGSVGLGIFGVALYFTPHSFPLALAGHFLVGLAGGIFIIPLQSFLQARAGEHSKGRVIAASNVLTFTGVFLGAGLFELLSGPLGLEPHEVLLVMATLSFAVTAYILTVLPDFMIRLSFFLLTHSIYRIKVRGRENLPLRGGALLVSNHVSFIDPFLIGASTQRFIRFLMYRSFYERPGLHWFAKLMGAIPIAEEDTAAPGRAVAARGAGAAARGRTRLHLRRGRHHAHRQLVALPSRLRAHHARHGRSDHSRPPRRRLGQHLQLRARQILLQVAAPPPLPADGEHRRPARLERHGVSGPPGRPETERRGLRAARRNAAPPGGIVHRFGQAPLAPPRPGRFPGKGTDLRPRARRRHAFPAAYSEAAPRGRDDRRAAAAHGAERPAQRRHHARRKCARQSELQRRAGSARGGHRALRAEDDLYFAEAPGDGLASHPARRW